MCIPPAQANSMETLDTSGRLPPQARAQNQVHNLHVSQAMGRDYDSHENSTFEMLDGMGLHGQNAPQQMDPIERMLIEALRDTGSQYGRKRLEGVRY